jgi:hypothetical protein
LTAAVAVAPVPGIAPPAVQSRRDNRCASRHAGDEDRSVRQDRSLVSPVRGASITVGYDLATVRSPNGCTGLRIVGIIWDHGCCAPLNGCPPFIMYGSVYGITGEDVGT